MSAKVVCPACSKEVSASSINEHLDNSCRDANAPAVEDVDGGSSTKTSPATVNSQSARGSQVSWGSIFSRGKGDKQATAPPTLSTSKSSRGKRNSDVIAVDDDPPASSSQPPPKRSRQNAKPTQAGSSKSKAYAPLAERLRPQTLSDFVGQSHLTGPDSLLLKHLESGASGSIIFWGPPGCGKTTLSRLLAERTGAAFKELSATGVGINDVRAVFEEAKGLLTLTGRKTILFLDEVHRFNRAQQDIFLPYIEQGQIQLVSATTENPSFKINGALLSRCRVFVLERLTDEDIMEIIRRAIQKVSPSGEVLADEPPSVSEPQHQTSSQPEPGSSQATICSSSEAPPVFPAYPQITPRILKSIASLSSGDARAALSLLELTLSSPTTMQESTLLDSLRRSVSTSYDRTGDSHYDMISALHKSVRGSDGSAALYWLARMLTAGEDPMFIARRMAVCASEDIGLADNHALPLAMATMQACQMIGMPECRINLAHLVSYLSEAPKSTRSYEGYNRAEAAAKRDQTLPVPLQIRNAPTKLMKELDYGKEYAYNPQYLHPVHNQYLPAELKGEEYLYKEGDTSDKLWDEGALKIWEREENEGKKWSGRKGAVMPSKS